MQSINQVKICIYEQIKCELNIKFNDHFKNFSPALVLYCKHEMINLW